MLFPPFLLKSHFSCLIVALLLIDGQDHPINYLVHQFFLKLVNEAKNAARQDWVVIASFGVCLVVGRRYADKRKGESGGERFITVSLCGVNRGNGILKHFHLFC